MKKWNQPGTLARDDEAKGSRFPFTMVAVLLMFGAGGAVFWFKGPDLVRASGDSASRLVSRAEQKFLAGDRYGALADLTEALSTQPNHAEALSQRAALYAEAKREDEAIADYTRAIELAPEEPGYYFGRAQLLSVIYFFASSKDHNG